ncbi:galactose-1-phosphate uridylyltransferase [Branchiibius sp. NY16-3462-2]|uniref:galactose-1-phosphate uridylyltransferase n=1 Tax=Branchiibius sp. NY16-3462-2 TaxID=1807500 RepID=UPI000798F346|nr:galactose-1-phosphate uridylyltransferase [Branchiibius sp. NY16-3462-2]KYH45069.1 galactose-1-phosphate uridylyltransferase [Branchiibius sp. NY16-3462-2]
MERTPSTLADGRQIIWYDADGTHRVPSVDRRPLEPSIVMSQMRNDPLTGEWIAVSSARQNRTYMPPADECPLCPSRDGRMSEIPSADYQVVAFENRFPSFATHIQGVEIQDDGFDQVRPATGRCEVLCFTSDHDSTFASLTPAQARLVVDAWADRTAYLNSLDVVKHVFPFENRGIEIGVTLQHPHGQIYGYPFIPPRAKTELRHAADYRAGYGHNMFGHIIAFEQDGPRVVASNEEWIAFVPFAARWPVEVHLYPLRRVLDLSELDEAQRDAFAVIYLDLLRRFDRMYDSRLPYIAGWQQAPAPDPGNEQTTALRAEAWLHLELTSIRRGPDKLKYLAGSESGQGAFIADILAEPLAERLRELA